VAGLIAEAREPLAPPAEEIEAAAYALVPAAELAAFGAALMAGLDPELPLQARDGGFVAAGVRPELDEARGLQGDSRQVVAAL